MIETNSTVQVEYTQDDRPERLLTEIPLSSLSAEHVIPGNRILGLRYFDDLVAFTENLAFILGSINPATDKPQGYYLRPGRKESVKDSLLNQVRKRHFNGSLSNFTVLMLLPEMLPNVPHVREEIEPNQSFAFMVIAEMRSTGRPIVGHARRIYGMYVATGQLEFFLSNHCTTYQAREINITSREFDSASFQKDLDKLLENAALGKRAYIVNGLRKIVSGGLPSLGKKR